MELLECNFCLGFWVYTVLIFFYNPTLNPQMIMSNTIFGIISSFAAFVAVTGWKSLFTVTLVD